MTNAEKDCVEKMFTSYIVKTIKGTRSDYIKKAFKIYNAETSLEVILQSNESDECILFTQTSGLCGLCSSCPNDRICTALYELPERQKYVMDRLIVDKYTEKEVADMLEITQQAVHYHKNKAIKNLLNSLTEMDTQE